MKKNYLEGTLKLFAYYKSLGDKTLEQLSENDINWQYNEDSNSIAVLVKHLWGNMLSRWTDFLTTDGEKEWRQRDAEFENDIKNKEDLLNKWNEGWDCLFSALNALTEKDLETIIYIRNEGHTVMEAINRQLAHYPYHIGQMVYIAKLLKGKHFKSLSIPKNKSATFNADKFDKEKSRKHFTDN
jgi:hypothetical protein